MRPRLLASPPFLLCRDCRSISSGGRCQKALAPHYSSDVREKTGCDAHTELNRRLGADIHRAEIVAFARTVTSDV